MTWKAKLTPLITQEQIAARVLELAAQIRQDYEGKPLVVLSVLKGSFIFAADLVRALDMPLTVEFLGVQSYGDSTVSSGLVQITQDVTKPLDGKHVLLVEDIVDTGLTSSYLIDALTSRRAASVRLCSLLHKPARAERNVPIAYLGFRIEDVFVVGYGLDHAQSYRHLPDLCVLET